MNIWKKTYSEDYRNHYYESLLKSKLNSSHEKKNILGHLVEYLQLKVSHKIFPGWFFPDWIWIRRATTQSPVDNKRCSDDRKEGNHGLYKMIARISFPGHLNLIHAHQRMSRILRAFLRTVFSREKQPQLEFRGYESFFKPGSELFGQKTYSFNI